MTFYTSLILYGQTTALENARCVLENLPQVRRVDCSSDMTEIKLLLSEKLNENSLIPLLAKSGISGFRLQNT